MSDSKRNPNNTSLLLLFLKNPLRLRLSIVLDDLVARNPLDVLINGLTKMGGRLTFVQFEGYGRTYDAVGG